MREPVRSKFKTDFTFKFTGIIKDIDTRRRFLPEEAVCFVGAKSKQQHKLGKHKFGIVSIYNISHRLGCVHYIILYKCACTHV